MELLYHISGHVLWGYSLTLPSKIGHTYIVSTSDESVPVAWPLNRGCGAPNDISVQVVQVAGGPLQTWHVLTKLVDKQHQPTTIRREI